MRSGQDDRVAMLRRDDGGRVEGPDLRRLLDQQKCRFERRGRRAACRFGGLQCRRGVAAGHPGAAAECLGKRVRMGDDPARHHVGAIADPRRIMADCRGGDAEILEVIETGNAGAVAPDPGIVEDCRRRAELRCEIGGIDPAMRGIDDDGAMRHRLVDAGNTVGNDNRRGGGGHRLGSQHEGEEIASSPRSSQ